MALGQDPRLSRDEIADDGVEVLTRGPIHEAFAIPLTANPRPNPVISERPPAAIDELPPDQQPEGAHVQWIPGYFAWDETGDDYVWISGLWRDTPPGRQWLPGHWTAADGETDGWQWVSGYWAAEDQGEIEYLPPPPASLEAGPSAEAPDADSFYAPGCWVYRDRRYYWRPGFWQRSRADWYYAPAHYSWTPAGYIFSDGYWDYSLARRGLLFAPVRFSPQYYGRQGWNYQPRYAIGYQGLLGSLFARADFGRYYFGDYYGANYNQQGFVPWFDYRVGRNSPDPLYQYSRWQSRNDPRWETSLRGSYQDRRAGNAPRPPTTLIQQRQMIQNITVNNTVNSGNKILKVTNNQAMVQQMSLAAPLTKGIHNEFKLQPVGKVRQAEQRQAAQSLRATALDRQKWETKLAAGDSRPRQPTDPSTKFKVQFAKSTGLAKNLVKAPPPPAIPKHVAQPLPKHENVKPLRVAPKGKGKGPAIIQGTPQAKEVKQPREAKKENNPPAEAKNENNPPAETKKKNNPPAETKKKNNPPAEAKEAKTPPPEAKKKDNPPPKTKKQKNPRKDDDVPSASTSNIRETIASRTPTGCQRLLVAMRSRVTPLKPQPAARAAMDRV